MWVVTFINANIYLKAFRWYSHLQSNNIPNGTALANLLKLENVLISVVFSFIIAIATIVFFLIKIHHGIVYFVLVPIVLGNLFWYRDLKLLVRNLDESVRNKVNNTRKD